MALDLVLLGLAVLETLANVLRWRHVRSVVSLDLFLLRLGALVVHGLLPPIGE
jgi:hypothetical protein